MTVYNLYIFNRDGACIFYKEWNRSKQSGLSQEQEFKQMFGLIIEMKSFVNKMAPSDLKEGFIGYKTSKYKMNYYETPSGIKFVLNTDLNHPNAAPSPRDLLHQLYEQILTPYVVRNPSENLNETIKSQLFDSKLDEFIRKSNLF